MKLKLWIFSVVMVGGLAYLSHAVDDLSRWASRVNRTGASAIAVEPLSEIRSPKQKAINFDQDIADLDRRSRGYRESLAVRGARTAPARRTVVRYAKARPVKTNFRQQAGTAAKAGSAKRR